MLQAVDSAREGFLCPQCHQDMSNMEMLQMHFQNVHMKPSTPTSKNKLFSFAKQKTKSIQHNTQNSNDPSKPLAQYFSFDPNAQYACQQYMGFTRSHSVFLQNIRKDQFDQVSAQRKQLFLRIELLTKTNEHIPRHGNSKERRKYEQGIVRWMEDSVASVCAACSKSFGISRRKHHCRLDGSVICNQCSWLLSFSTARCITDTSLLSSSSASSESFKQLTALKTLISSVTMNEKSDEDQIRICTSCAGFLEKFYRQICFHNIPKSDIFQYYEKMIQAQKDYIHFQPTYLAIIDSILKGDTKHQISDAQQAYRQLSTSYATIDSISKQIATFAEKSANIIESDSNEKNRYLTLARNIRTYAIQILQNLSLSTKRVPTDEDIKRTREERRRIDDENMAKIMLSIPGMNCNSLEIPEELKPFIQQYQQVTQFIQTAKSAGRHDEVRLLESNLKELAQAMQMAMQD